MPIAKPNVHIAVAAKGRGRKAVERLVRVLRLSTAEQAIVFCCARDECERVAECLRRNGLDAEAYHAGIDDRAGVEARAMRGANFRQVGVHGCTGGGVQCCERRTEVQVKFKLFVPQWHSDLVWTCQG
jgi:hypothetical protein